MPHARPSHLLSGPPRQLKQLSQITGAKERRAIESGVERGATSRNSWPFGGVGIAPRLDRLGSSMQGCNSFAGSSIRQIRRVRKAKLLRARVRGFMRPSANRHSWALERPRRPRRRPAVETLIDVRRVQTAAKPRSRRGKRSTSISYQEFQASDPARRNAPGCRYPLLGSPVPSSSDPVSTPCWRGWRHAPHTRPARIHTPGNSPCQHADLIPRVLPRKRPSS